jgi:hypothetical protein
MAGPAAAEDGGRGVESPDGRTTEAVDDPRRRGAFSFALAWEQGLLRGLEVDKCEGEGLERVVVAEEGAQPRPDSEQRRRAAGHPGPRRARAGGGAGAWRPLDGAIGAGRVVLSV